MNECKQLTVQSRIDPINKSNMCGTYTYKYEFHTSGLRNYIVLLKSFISFTGKDYMKAFVIYSCYMDSEKQG